MNKKEFRTLDEQIDILRNKGLTINNEEQTKEVLLKENYFFINGYRNILYTKDRKFIKGTTFEELYSVFLFDRTFRNILFKNLLIIENNIKSVISYQLSKKYGYKEADYLKPSNFNQNFIDSRRVIDVINKMKRQIRVNGDKHTATLHYMSKYGYVPLWILVKVLSFGLINELYGILKEEDKKEIADIYNLDPETLKVYLSLLANYRNLCAHEDIVYEHRTQVSIPDTKYHSDLKIPKVDNEYIYGKNDIFAIVIIFKVMLSNTKFSDFMGEVNRAIKVFDKNVGIIENNVLLERMGFPSNYEEIL
ncbi:MAG: Abi family protein [Bacilli bacterium]|nr:Abi family protein [Bacilli bacterium]